MATTFQSPTLPRMKNICTRLAFGSLLLAPTATSAQSAITLTNTGYTAVANDSLAIVSNPTALPAMGTAGGANATWDLSAATYNPGGSISTRLAPSGTAFPTASYLINLYYNFAGPLSYAVQQYVGLEPTGMKRLGETVPMRQALPIGALTGNTADSLIFPQQVSPYTPAEVMIPFPATAGSHWSTTAKYSTAFNLTYTAAGLVNAPCQKRTTRIVTDTVTGWGRMRIRTAAGTTSGYMDMLQVRRHLTVVDSFFLGGSPAPATLLAGFGLTQGMTTEQYRVLFHRVGELSPLVSVYYPNATYSGAPITDNFFVHQQRLAAPTGIGAVPAADLGVRLFPNPAIAGSELRLAIPAAVGRAEYVLMDATGRIAAAGVLDKAAEKIITLPASAPAGMYYFTARAVSGVQTIPVVVR